MNFDPELYLFKIQKERIDDEDFFVGTVEEFPDICVYEDSHIEAYESLKIVLKSLSEQYQELGREFPKPAEKAGDFSGRFTVRVEKTTHKELSLLAQKEGVSFNALTSSLLIEGLTIKKCAKGVNSSFQPLVNELAREVSNLNRALLKEGYISRSRQSFTDVYTLNELNTQVLIAGKESYSSASSKRFSNETYDRIMSRSRERESA